MGWNDHVEIQETRCLKCDEIGDWEYWDEVALQRYSGSIGQKLGHDAKRHGRCPYCGSTEGEVIDEEE